MVLLFILQYFVIQCVGFNTKPQCCVSFVYFINGRRLLKECLLAILSLFFINTSVVRCEDNKVYFIRFSNMIQLKFSK